MGSHVLIALSSRMDFAPEESVERLRRNLVSKGVVSVILNEFVFELTLASLHLADIKPAEEVIIVGSVVVEELDSRPGTKLHNGHSAQVRSLHVIESGRLGSPNFVAVHEQIRFVSTSVVFGLRTE